MKLTTDYERNKTAPKSKSSDGLLGCYCRTITEQLLTHGTWIFGVEESQKLGNRQQALLKLNGEACTHKILLATILTLDKPYLLSVLNEHRIALVNLDQHRRSILHLAVIRQASNCVREILQMHKGETVQWILRKDKHGVTPLHLAARLDCVKILRFFLNELSNPSCDIFAQARDENSQSPLHYAAAAGSLAACELLLGGERCDFPLDQRDRYGQTPLMYAVGYEHAEEVVRLLARKKTIAITTRNKRGMTALHIAVLAENTKALKILLNELRASPTVFDHLQRTPLHYAALFGRADAAAALLAAGATNETRDIYNVTAAHYAAQADHFYVFRTILNSSTDVMDNENRTCFMWAVIAQSEDTVRRMLQEKNFTIERSHRDRNKYTALHLAALNGNKNICRMLVEAEFEILGRDHFEATPEHLAASEGHVDALTVFAFRRGGLRHPPLDIKKRPPFFYACLGGQAHAVRKMVEEQRSSIDKQQTDCYGYSALHCAVLAGSLQCVEQLVMNKFNVAAEDNEKRTPYQLAKESGKHEIVEFLRAYTQESPTTATNNHYEKF